MGESGPPPPPPQGRGLASLPLGPKPTLTQSPGHGPLPRCGPRRASVLRPARLSLLVWGGGSSVVSNRMLHSFSNASFQRPPRGLAQRLGSLGLPAHTRLTPRQHTKRNMEKGEDRIMLAGFCGRFFWPRTFGRSIKRLRLEHNAPTVPIVGAFCPNRVPTTALAANSWNRWRSTWTASLSALDESLRHREPRRRVRLRIVLQRVLRGHRGPEELPATRRSPADQSGLANQTRAQEIKQQKEAAGRAAGKPLPNSATGELEPTQRGPTSMGRGVLLTMLHIVSSHLPSHQAQNDRNQTRTVITRCWSIIGTCWFFHSIRTTE